MDKFVTRTPTWKTKTFSAVSAASCGRSSLGKKAMSKQDPNTKKKPVTLDGVLKPLQHLNTKPGAASRRPTMLDERLLKLFASQPDQPLVEANASDSGCSSSSENYAFGVEYGRQFFDTENTPPTLDGKNFLNLNDQTDCIKPGATLQQQQQTLVPSANKVTEERPSTPQNAMLTEEAEVPSTPSVDNWLIKRIQRDLSSPSASVRVRALKAMKSPTKTVYQQFDVPHDEQSLITAEDRRTPEPPKSIQELMEHIIVYVEVRTGEDNRSAGVKKVISALGAKVNDKLLRDTTHVIFKDGLLSTYKKAKNWNIPVVSILWIEACKNQRKICDPNDFPISNIDRYENPELYEKMKRHKSMQPDSEANKRVRVRATTPKNMTPKKGAIKKTSTLIDDTPTSSSASNKKTDISRFFQQLGSNKKTLPGWKPCDTPATPANSSTAFVDESPATQLLNRMNDDYYKVVPKLNNNQKPQESNDDPELNNFVDLNAKKSLNFLTPTLETTPTKTKRTSNRRRSTILMSPSVEATTNSIGSMSLSPNGSNRKIRTPCRNTRRRSSIHVATSINITKEKEVLGSAKKKATNKNSFKTISEEEVTVTKKVTAAITTPNRSCKRRQTTYTPRPLEISGDNQETKMSLDSLAAQEQTAVISRTSVRRRTLFTPNKIDQSVSNDAIERTLAVTKDTTSLNSASNPCLLMSDAQCIKNKTFGVITPFSSNIASSTHIQNECSVAQTPPQETGSLLEQHSITNIFSSTRLPGSRRTLFNVSMDIISQRLQNINQSARRSMARPSASDLEVRRCSLEHETPKLAKCPTPVESISTPNLSTHKAKCMEPVKLRTASKKNVDVEFISESKETESSEDSSAPAPKKKRKLFMPNDGSILTPPTTSSTSTLESGSSTAANVRRRRTLMPLMQPQWEAKAPSTPKIARETRRSTLDFEDINKAKSSLSVQKKLATDAKPSTSSNSETVSVSTEEASKQLSQTLTVARPTPAVPKIGTKSKAQGPFLVYTNMHKEQIEVIKEAINKLGYFQLEDNVTATTSHIVSLEPRRTLNLLRALLRGLWILEYTWIQDSIQAGKWLSEEPYELCDFSRAVKICRSERQAFGSTYKSELFTGLGAFYVSSRCGPIPKDNLLELIYLCGGKVVDQRKKAKYILGDANKALEDKIYITPNWILDSITQMQLQRLSKYASGTLSIVNVPTTSLQAAKQQNPPTHSDTYSQY